MKRYVIDATRSREAFAIVIALIVTCVAGAATGAITFMGERGVGLLAGAPWLLRPVSVALIIALGLLALQAMVHSATYWELDEHYVRYRSQQARLDVLGYVWAMLRGCEPAADVVLRVDQIDRVELRWRKQVVSTGLTRGLPATVYPLTVVFGLRGGVSVKFEGLEQYGATLAEALQCVLARPGVTLCDKDNLLSILRNPKQTYCEQMEKLARSTGAYDASVGVGDGSSDVGNAPSDTHKGENMPRG